MLFIQRATLLDVPSIERLAHTHPTELGFIRWGAIDRAVEEGNVLVALVEQEQFPVGFVSFYLNKRTPETTIQYLVVEENRRRLGIGRALVGRVKELTWQDGRNIVRLRCRHGLPANEFYKRLGFQLGSSGEDTKHPKNLWFIPLSS